MSFSERREHGIDVPVARPATLGGLMSGTLETGLRRGPGDGDVDAVFAAL
jgi:hypothetical protein